MSPIFHKIAPDRRACGRILGKNAMAITVRADPGGSKATGWGRRNRFTRESALSTMSAEKNQGLAHFKTSQGGEHVSAHSLDSLHDSTARGQRIRSHQAARKHTARVEADRLPG